MSRNRKDQSGKGWSRKPKGQNRPFGGGLDESGQYDAEFGRYEDDDIGYDDEGRYDDSYEWMGGEDDMDINDVDADEEYYDEYPE